MEWNRMIEDKLTENWQWLMRTVMLKEIVHVLIQDKVVSLDFWMNLKEKQISEQDRNANFFFEVSKFTKDRYKQFVEALKKGGHTDLAELLELKPEKKKSVLGPKNERIKKDQLAKKKTSKSPERLSEQERSPSEIKRENFELRNHLTTISTQVGKLHSVTRNFSDGELAQRDRTFVATPDSFIEKIHNIEEHEKYLELQDTNQKQEMAIKHLRSEIVDLKVELNHQINQLEIKLKDAQVRRELKEQEVNNLVSKITGLKTQINSLSKDIEHEKEEKKTLKLQSTKLTKENKDLQEKICQQTSTVMSLESDIMQMKAENEAARGEVKQLEAKLEYQERLTEEQKQANQDLMEDINQAHSKTEEKVEENKKLLSRVNEFEKEILDLKVKLHRYEADKQRGKLKTNIVSTWR